MGDLSKSFIKSLALKARLSVIGKDIMLFKLQGPEALLCSPLSVSQFLRVFAKVLVSLSGLSEFGVNILVLTGEGLDVFNHLLHFSALCLSDLGLLIKLLSEASHLVPECLDLVFSLEEAALDSVFFATDDRHLMLNIREVSSLPLELETAFRELLSLGIKLALEFIPGRV